MPAQSSQLPVYLFVLPWSLQGVGGVNQVVINLAREMQKQGQFEPLFLIADWDAPSPVAGSEHGLATLRWRIRSYHAGMGIKEKLAYRLWERGFSRALEALCIERNIAAINMHYPGPIALALQRCIARMKRPVPLLLSFHGTDLTTLRRASAEEQLLWQRALPRMDALVACSRALRLQLIELFGPALKVTVVHNGLDAARFAAQAATAARPGTPAARTILSVGKFEHQKGQDVLIDAFAGVAAEFPDVSLTLAGATDHALPALRQQAERLQLSGRIRFLQDVPYENIAALFAGASLFALPSRLESFGLVLLEAGAFGLPVVASAVGGVPEILTDGQTAHLVPPDDVTSLARALRTMLADTSAAQAMGARLREHVAANFSWTASNAGYVELLRQAALPDATGSLR